MIDALEMVELAASSIGQTPEHCVRLTAFRRGVARGGAQSLILMVKVSYRQSIKQG